MVKMGDGAYMAAYTGGELMKFDPSTTAQYPDNPSVVADPPGGMRPLGVTSDSTSIYYSCSTKNGKWGSTLTKYNTDNGACTYSVNPLPY